VSGRVSPMRRCGSVQADGERVDRSFQTDARAKLVRPGIGIASDASGSALSEPAADLLVPEHDDVAA
jgi:hypothetical protein